MIVLVVLAGACLVVLVSLAWLKRLVEGEGDDVDYGADADEAIGVHTRDRIEADDDGR